MESRCRLTLIRRKARKVALSRDTSCEARAESRCVCPKFSQVLLDCDLLKSGVWSVADAYTPSARSRGFGGTSDTSFAVVASAYDLQAPTINNKPLLLKVMLI